MFVDLLRSPVMAIGEEEVDIEGIVVKQLAAPLLFFLLVHFQLEERAAHARRRMARGEGQRAKNERRTSAGTRGKQEREKKTKRKK